MGEGEATEYLDADDVIALHGLSSAARMRMPPISCAAGKGWRVQWPGRYGMPATAVPT